MMNLNQFRVVILNLGFAILLVVGTDYFFLYNHPSVLIYLFIVQEHFLALQNTLVSNFMMVTLKRLGITDLSNI